MRTLTITLLILVISGSWAGISAQELVVNGTFDDNVDDWDLQNLTFGTIEHHSLDSGGDPLSGSALITNSFADPSMNLATIQCIHPLPPDRDYVFGGSIRMADGTTTTGISSIQIWFWDDANCSAGHGGSVVSPPATTSDIGWKEVRATATAPPTSIAARLTLWNTKNEAGGDLGIHFDNVFLRTASIFSDGFETGDTGQWD